MAYPTIVSTGHAGTPSGGSSKSMTVTTAVGDLVIVVGYVEPASEGSSSATFGTFTPDAFLSLATGFPLETDPSTITTTDDHRMYVWYGYATTAGSLTVSIATSNSSIYWGLAGLAVRGGPTSGQPFSETSTAIVSQGASGITASPPVSLTLAAANSLVLWAYTDWNGSNPGAPSGYTLVDKDPSYGGQPTIWSNTYASSGATGTIGAGRSGNDSGMTAALLSLRAPSGGGGIDYSHTKLGSTSLSALYLGSTSISKLYLGSTTIF